MLRLYGAAVETAVRGLLLNPMCAATVSARHFGSQEHCLISTNTSSTGSSRSCESAFVLEESSQSYWPSSACTSTLLSPTQSSSPGPSSSYQTVPERLARCTNISQFNQPFSLYRETFNSKRQESFPVSTTSFLHTYNQSFELHGLTSGDASLLLSNTSCLPLLDVLSRIDARIQSPEKTIAFIDEPLLEEEVPAIYSLDSVKRKRKRKMNKHKYQKRMKKQKK